MEDSIQHINTPEEILEYQWKCFTEELTLLREMLRTRENADSILSQLKPMYQTMGGSTEQYLQYQEKLNSLIGDACNLPLKFD